MDTARCNGMEWRARRDDASKVCHTSPMASCGFEQSCISFDQMNQLLKAFSTTPSIRKACRTRCKSVVVVLATEYACSSFSASRFPQCDAFLGGACGQIS